jgi:hypothetical protein
MGNITCDYGKLLRVTTELPTWSFTLGGDPGVRVHTDDAPNRFNRFMQRWLLGIVWTPIVKPAPRNYGWLKWAGLAFAVGLLFAALWSPLVPNILP